MVTQVQYICAIEIPILRQPFIDQVDLEDSAKYIEKVIYSEKKFKIYNEDIPQMECIANECSRRGIPGGRAIIEIFPYSFSNQNLSTLEDFLSILIDHEGYHAKEFYESPPIIRPKFGENPELKDKEFLLEIERYHNNMEIRALKNQLKKIESRKRNVSIKFLLNIYSQLSLRLGEMY